MGTPIQPRGKSAAEATCPLAGKPHLKCHPLRMATQDRHAIIGVIREGVIREGVDVPAAPANGNVQAVTRRQVFVLAAALAATALTGAVAIAGLKRSPPAAPVTPQIGQTITPQPATPARVEPGD